MIDMKFAKDNAVSALGKTIKYHGQELNDLNKYLDIWVNKLPITKDHTEGKCRRMLSAACNSRA